MNRRGFIKLLSAAPMAAAIGPALGAIVVPARSIFLPKREVVRYTYPAIGLAPTPGGLVVPSGGNRLLTAAEFRALLQEELERVFSEKYDSHSDEWARLFANPGEAEDPTEWT